MTSFSVTSIKKIISEFQEDSTQFPTQQKSNPLFPSGRTRDTSKRPSISRRFCTTQHASVRMARQHRPDDIQCSREIQISLQTQIGKTACNRPNARATPPGRGLNKATRDERYARRLQFTVQTLYAYVRTPPRELRF
jgi:hypothetical protein